MAPPTKVTKRTVPSSQSRAAMKELSKDDLETIAVVFRNSNIKVETQDAADELKITKKAWSARWVRAKKRLAKIGPGADDAQGTASKSTGSKKDQDSDDEDAGGAAEDTAEDDEQV